MCSWNKSMLVELLVFVMQQVRRIKRNRASPLWYSLDLYFDYYTFIWNSVRVDTKWWLWCCLLCWLKESHMSLRSSPMFCTSEVKCLPSFQVAWRFSWRCTTTKRGRRMICRSKKGIASRLSTTRECICFFFLTAAQLQLRGCVCAVTFLLCVCV